MDIHGEAYTIDRPLIDWLTVTSFDENAREVSLKIFSGIAPDEPRKQGVKRMQYLGESVSSPLGSVFYGEAIQRGRWHSMIQASGEVCNQPELLNPIMSGIRQGWVNCTRIDIQMTVYRPDDWNQWGLFNRCKLVGKPTGWIESLDKEGNPHRTVYIGQRTAGKFLRVYEKYTSRYLLRAEYECKAGMANAVFKMLSRGDETPSTLFKLFIQNTDDKELSALYLPALETIDPAARPKVERRESKTAVWLMQTVLPSFSRYINEHGHDERIPQAFTKALYDAEYWHGDD